MRNSNNWPGPLNCENLTREGEEIGKKESSNPITSFLLKA